MVATDDGVEERTPGVELVAIYAGLQAMEAAYQGLALLRGGAALTVVLDAGGKSVGLSFVVLGGVLVAVGWARALAARLLYNGEWLGWVGVTLLTGVDVVLSVALLGVVVLAELTASPVLVAKVPLNALVLGYLLFVRDRFDADERADKRAYFRRVYGPAEDESESADRDADREPRPKPTGGHDREE